MHQKEGDELNHGAKDKEGPVVLKVLSMGLGKSLVNWKRR